MLQLWLSEVPINCSGCTEQEEGRIMNVRDTTLYVGESKSSIRTIAVHGRTREKMRLTDGVKRPIKIIYPDGRVEIKERK